MVDGQTRLDTHAETGVDVYTSKKEPALSKQFDQLTKELASGISRRKAFSGFGAGIGAVVLGLISRRPARADIGVCDAMCRDNNDCGYRNHGQCVSACNQASRSGSPFCEPAVVCDDGTQCSSDEQCCNNVDQNGQLFWFCHTNQTGCP